MVDIALGAGHILLTHYDAPGGMEIQQKGDGSPLTSADLAADAYIVRCLRDLAPQIPVISEESAERPSLVPGAAFWLVDPLDGTKGFIRRTGEFTLNIGLVEHGRPVLGVLYAPARHVIYFTSEEGYARRWTTPGMHHMSDLHRAWKQCLQGAERIQTRVPDPAGVTVIASVAHRTPETEAYIASLRVKEQLAVSSALKFGVIAEGKADVYPRFGPTMEWDTAAGHALLNAAGGRVENHDGGVLEYGKQDFLNDWFVARGV